MKKIWWSSGCGRIELQIPEPAIAACSHSGQCDTDVEFWEPQIDWSTITRKDMETVLKEYGAWDDLQTVPAKTLRERLTWIACGDLDEEDNKEEVPS
jgi:hypothetical protein